MKKNTECNHGRKLWWNYGDGKPRHFTEDGKNTEMIICNDPGKASEEK